MSSTTPKFCRSFTFVGYYSDDAPEAGPRTDIVMAYHREQALRLAAKALIEDNEWDVETCSRYKDLTDIYEAEIEILYEREGGDGDICPACTSESTRDTLIEQSSGTIHQCETCGFSWVPLGGPLPIGQRPCWVINEQLDDFERKMWPKDESPEPSPMLLTQHEADLCEAAACLWEAAMEILGRASTPPHPVRHPLSARCEEIGTAALRNEVIALAPQCHADWQQAVSDGYDDMFDWDFVPAWLDRQIVGGKFA